MKPRIVSFGEYLDALESVHRVDCEEIAECAGVSVGEVRRWRRGTHSPPFGTVEALTNRWGGDARLVYLGVVLERFARRVGCNLEEAATMPFSKRRATPAKRRRTLTQPDRRQMSLLSD